MGYTHYWEGTPTLDPETVERVKRIIAEAERQGIAVRGWDGTGEPEVSTEVIRLNGDAATGNHCETLFIKPKHIDFAFCKTNEEPYDAVVVAILDTLKSDTFSWRSDGKNAEHAKGLRLAAYAAGE